MMQDARANPGKSHARPKLTDPAFAGSAAVARLWRALGFPFSGNQGAHRDVGLAESGFALPRA
jgi:hypothetical protein